MKSTVTFEPLPGCDFTPLIRETLRNSACARIEFRPGRYDFHPTFAAEHYLFVSNNDEGLKRIAFPLFGREGIEIDGSGAHFIFHGGIVPFVLSGCADARLRGFSMDWAIPFHGEAEVLAADPQGVDLHICEGFSHRVTDGRLEFGTEPFEVKNILAFDTVRRETAFLARDNYGIGSRCTARETGPSLVRLDAALSQPLPAPGDILAIMGERRDFPGIVIADSANVEIEDVAIHHAGGMGVIAQRSADLTLRQVTVAPPPGNHRMLSTTADATHFVNCRGTIRLLDCVFENQMDDATNIHGLYAEIVRADGPDAVLVRLRHHQQFGVPIAVAGDRLEFVRGGTLATFHEAGAESVEVLNKEITRIRLREPFAAELHPGDVIGNLTWNPDIEIQGCLCQGNRARGFLVSSRGRTVIEGNTFHTPGAAILVASDAYDWFESGHVRDMLIRRNRFDTCNYGIWGRAAIQILPRIAHPDSALPRYHRNIRIEDNTFAVFDPRIVLARSVDGLTITGNRVTSSDAYPAQNPGATAFDTQTCTGVTIADNLIETASAAACATPA